MTASELRDWGLFYQVEPFGATRDNLHAGIVASMLFNLNRKKGTEPVQPADFLLIPADERRQRSLAKGLAALAARAKPARRTE